MTTNLLGLCINSPEYRMGRADFAWGNVVTAQHLLTAHTLADLHLLPDDIAQAMVEEHSRLDNVLSQRIVYFHRLVYDFLERHPGLEPDLRAVFKNNRFVEKLTTQRAGHFIEYDLKLEDWYRQQPYFVVGKIAEGATSFRLATKVYKEYRKNRKQLKSSSTVEKNAEQKVVERKLNEANSRIRNILIRMIQRLVDMNDSHAITIVKDICSDSVLVKAKIEEFTNSQ